MTTFVTVDGSMISDFPAFTRQMAEKLNGGASYFGWDMHSFQDCLLGGYGGDPPFVITVINAESMVRSFDHRGFGRYCESMIEVIKNGGRGLVTAESLKWFQEAAAKAFRCEGDTLLDILISAVASAKSSITLLSSEGSVIRRGGPALQEPDRE